MFALAASIHPAGAQPSTADAVVPAPSAQEWRGAECVAALRRRADAEVPAARAGDAKALDRLRTDLERGAALIGRGYLDGARDEARGQALLAAAAKAQERLDRSALHALQERCAQQADATYADAPGWQRLVVRKVAERRLAKLLGGSAPTQAAAPATP